MARYRTDPAVSSEEEEAGEPCQRGDWCASRTIVTAGDGSRSVRPGLTSRGFCDPCRQHIAACLAELPSAYGRLEGELAERSRGSGTVRSPLGPRTPLREDVDALMRLLAETLAGWHERVAVVARLAMPDTALSRQRDITRAVGHSAAVLEAHLTVLIALPPGPMWRPRGDAMVLEDLAGTDAGHEILRLHYRCRAVLGETRAQPEILDGVPCKMCEAMALERAEPPSDPKREAMWSVCAACRHTMSLKDFRAWADWYARWAERAAPVCRRCQSGRCDECAWQACPCRAAGHQVA